MTASRSNVVAMKLTATVAESRIHAIAEHSGNVIFGDHARDQMVKREIFDSDVLRVLRSGHVDEAPRKTKHGEWQCKVVLKIRGIRSVGVVTIILHGDRLFLKTVEWEDLT